VSFRKSCQGNLFEERIFQVRPEDRKEPAMPLGRKVPLEERPACAEML